MILIRKGKEPASLTAYRKQPYAYFDGCNKEDIRKNLLKEQGHLCAYCMRRIRSADMQIEHWRPEVGLSEKEKLDYSNMLGVCTGHMEGTTGKEDTCDAQKGDQRITIDPREVTHIATIGYKKGTGEIFSSNSEMDEDLSKRLNLNCERQSLPQNRKAELQRAIRKMREIQQQGEWRQADIDRLLRLYNEPDKEGRKREYAGIVLWYFRRGQ